VPFFCAFVPLPRPPPSFAVLPMCFFSGLMCPPVPPVPFPRDRELKNFRHLPAVRPFPLSIYLFFFLSRTVLWPRQRLSRPPDARVTARHGRAWPSVLASIVSLRVHVRLSNQSYVSFELSSYRSERKFWNLFSVRLFLPQLGFW